MKRLMLPTVLAAGCILLAIPSHAIITTSANLTGPTTVNEGSYNYYTYSWNITHDTSADHTHSGTVNFDWGDGTSQNVGVGGFNNSQSRGKTYGDDGTYVITVSNVSPIGLWDTYTSWGNTTEAKRGDAFMPTRTLAVTVLNVAPTILSLTAPLTVDTGESFLFSGSATDPGNDILTYSWDLDNDGHYDDAVGASGNHSFASEGLYSIGLRVDDGDGGFDYDSVTVDVIPEPAALALIGFSAMALWSKRRFFPAI